MFKFLHTSDIHLDSPLRGLQRYGSAPVEEFRDATRKSLQNLINLAINESVDFVLISGDLYDGDWKDFNTGLFLIKEMAKLLEHNIKVFIISGNHDAESQITSHLRLPENVYRFSASEPETKLIDDLGVAIHGQGFPTRVVSIDLSRSYPDAIPSIFNIGMLHTSLNGREGHEPYSPCSIEGLLSKDYDYWALGHVHKREVVSANPLIIFPGNTQGRNIRETGPKGCTIVTVRDKENVHAVHHDIDLLRWSFCDLNVSGFETPDDILDLLSGQYKAIIEDNSGHPLATRVSISGRCKAHNELSNNPEKWIAEIHALAAQVGYGSLWIEKVIFRTDMDIDIEELIKSGDPLGELIKFIEGLESLDEIIPQIKNDLQQLKRQLPKDLLYGDDAIDIEFKGNVKAVINEVKQLLMAKLVYR